MNEPRITCHDDRRKAALRAGGRLNGIDYVEVHGTEAAPELHVYLLRNLAGGDLPAWLDKAHIAIDGPGGLTVEDVRAERAQDPERDDVVELLLSGTGGSSTYVLRLGAGLEPQPEGLDPRYASASFRFVPETPAELDCLVPETCPPQPSTVPELDYLAKDYAGFRRLLLDRLAATLPGWRDRQSPDLYLTLVEALAYHADHLSYAQDAVATEAYLDTARLRTSVRRHARLVDYRMHEGCNARAWVTVEVKGEPSVRADQLQFLTRPAGVPLGKPVLTPEELPAPGWTVPRSSYEVFEPLPEPSREQVAEADVGRPAELAARLQADDPALGPVRESLPEQAREALERAQDPATDPSRAAAVLAALLDGLLDDPGLALSAEGATEALRRHGSANALTGATLRRHNRDLLQELFPQELLAPAGYRFHEAHNTIPFHTWHRAECCLPRGATSATLRDHRLKDTDGRALDHLRAGEVLILEELISPRTGNPADVDPGHRHAVRLTDVRRDVDPLGDVPIVEIAWDAVDALPFRMALSAVGPAPECALLEDLSVARGNVVLADHGETVRGPGCVELYDGPRTVPAVPFDPPHDVVPARGPELCCAGEHRLEERPIRSGQYRPALSRRPVVHAQPLPAQPLPAARTLAQDPRRALPRAELFSPVDRPRPWSEVLERIQDDTAVPPRRQRYERWRPRPDLLRSDADDRHVVVEVDDDGTACIRFGDGELGARPVPDTRHLAWYRVGGGTAGNVGREAISTVLLRGETGGDGGIVGVRNPLPARGGTDPEPVTEVRLHAPHAFREVLRRAVAPEDYAAIVLRDFPDRVQRAVAYLEPAENNRTPVQVLIDPYAAARDDPELGGQVYRHLLPYRRIGHVLERVQSAEHVAIDLALAVSLAPHHWRGAVLRQLLERFGTGVRADGRPGFFHPDALTPGQGIAVSAVVAAAVAVPGVARVRVTTLRRHSPAPPTEAEIPVNDVLEMGPTQIAQLDNDPDRPEHGVLTIELNDTEEAS